MSSRHGTCAHRESLFGLHFKSISCGLLLALGGIGLVGCDKVKIPGIEGTGAATATPAPTTPPAAPAAAQPGTQQPMAPAPSQVELPKTDGKTAVKSFLEKARIGGNIEDQDLFAVAQHTDGLDLVEKLIIPGAKITDKATSVFSKFPKLTAIDISNTEITNAGVEFVKEMPLLTSLTLSKTKVTDVGLSTIADHPNIKELYLSGTGITDRGLALLDKLEGLEVLDISYTSLTGAGFEKFRNNKTLRVLSAQHSHIMPDAFKFLKGAPIEELNLDVTHSTNDFTLLHIGSLKKLKILKLEFCSAITDAGMAKLGTLKDLEQIYLRNATQLTSASLNPLKGSKKLKVLNIVGTAIAESDARKLQKMLGLKDLRIEK